MYANKKQKSLKLNMVLNAIKGLMSILFPLITFPYVSRVLGVENLGRVNFANSITSYFVLFAGLGISTYAIREGTLLREKKTEIETFASEMLSINLWSTVFSYACFFILIFIVPKLWNYRVLLVFFSLQIVFKTIGIEWLYSIYEDYAYITIRSIVFQVVSLVLLFVFVKSENDVNIYALITAFSGVGSNLLNYIHSRKYCRVKVIKKTNWRKHIKPILILFAMTATVTIYVSSDAVMLGFLCGDYSVGIYSVSTKVYSTVKTVLSAILVVSIPRLSAEWGNKDKDRFSTTADDVYKTLITVVAPSITGIIILHKEIILLLSGPDYISASSSLVLLSIAMFFCMGAWFWGQCILIPCKRETTVFMITVICAAVNIVLNFFFIPIWKENAAAITTILAEGISFVWCSIEGRKETTIHNLLIHYGKVACGCGAIAAIGVLVRMHDHSMWANIGIIIPLSIIVYFGTEIVLKNEAVINPVKNVIRKITRQSGSCQ